MPAPLFYLFAAVTLIFGIMVVTSRNPVSSALSLVGCFTGLAALFISLDAYFIGIIQILVYAGAVMVLFLFIIMLLDIKSETIKAPRMGLLAGGVALALLFTVQMFTLFSGYEEGKVALADRPLQLAEAAKTTQLKGTQDDLKSGTLPDTKLMGETLFHQYPFHLQVVALLLLAGTVGVVVLSRRDKDKEDAA
jgi:NADH-quinone oxidoreductase subunit J